MNGLGHDFQVVDVPEQVGITLVGNAMVHDRTVRRRVLSAANLSSALAGVVVADEDALPELDPASGLVPGADRAIGAVGFVPCLSHGGDQGLDLAYQGAEGLEL